jgi:hypothetical protein
MTMSKSVRALGAALGIAFATAGAAQARGGARETRPAVPEPAPPPRPAIQADATDGERAIDKWGFAYFGSQTFRFGNFNGAPNDVDVFTVGVRRWQQPSPGSVHKWAYDAGVGLVMSNTTHFDPALGGATYKASALGASLHVGIPVALAQGRHVTFLAAPEVDALYATGGNDYPGPSRTKWKGAGLGLGAKAGFELFFGFLGMPQFSLQGTFGLALRYTSSTGKLGNTETKDSTWRFGTDRPLGFMVGDIAAIYYY